MHVHVISIFIHCYFRDLENKHSKVQLDEEFLAKCDELIKYIHYETPDFILGGSRISASRKKA